MTTCQVPDPGRAGQFTQSCPSCDGTMPAEAVCVSGWRRKRQACIGALLTRKVSMCCPHCDYRQERQETVPESAFLAHVQLIGDRIPCR